MPEFYKVANVEDVPPGTKKLVEVDFVPVLLFNVAGLVWMILFGEFTVKILEVFRLTVWDWISLGCWL